MNFNQIGDVTATFRISGTIALGDLVAMKENQIVQKAAANAEVIGVCASLNGNYAGIQVKGGVTVPSNGTLTPGYRQIKATADGKAALATSGAYHLVVDAGADTAVVIL